MSKRAASTDDVPTDSQAQCLEMASKEPIKRLPGGFWVEGSHNGVVYQGMRYLGTPTIKACERRGWLESVGDYPESWKCSRRITDAGLNALAAWVLE